MLISLAVTSPSHPGQAGIPPEAPSPAYPQAAACGCKQRFAHRSGKHGSSVESVVGTSQGARQQAAGEWLLQSPVAGIAAVTLLGMSFVLIWKG